MFILLKYKHFKKHAMPLCYCFGYDIHCKVYWNANVESLRAQQKMMQSNFLQNIYSEQVLTHIHREHKKSFKLNSFEMPWRFIRKWTHSNIRRAVSHSSCKYDKDVHLILKRKIHTGQQWMTLPDIAATAHCDHSWHSSVKYTTSSYPAAWRPEMAET